MSPTACDDADLAWWFRSHRACAACGANMPVFSRIRDPMFGFIEKTKAPAHDDSQPVEPESAASDAQGWRERLRGSGMARGLSALFARNPRLDEALLDDIDTALLGSEEHTSELQSLMRISYAVFCLKTKKANIIH